MANPPVSGHYKITHMDTWDRDFVNAEVEGYIRFDSHGDGEFQFGYVHGWLDCEETERDGKPAIEFTWDGNDEMDPASGRGWVVLEADGTLKGKLVIHMGDSSAFTAEKKAKAKKASVRKVKAVDATAGNTVEIDADKFRRGRVRHADLPEQTDPQVKRGVRIAEGKQ